MADTGTKLTPMMERYLEVKGQHPDSILLFRMGDFYELFFEDAELAARQLGLTLTSRDKGSPNPIPMAGFPYHALDGYLQKLIRLGNRVAICEQSGRDHDERTPKGPHDWATQGLHDPYRGCRYSNLASHIRGDLLDPIRRLARIPQDPTESAHTPRVSQ